MNVVEKEGKTVDLAIASALEELGISEDQAEIEIIRKEGLFKSAYVRVTVKRDKWDEALDFTNELLLKMNLNTKAELVKNGREAVINLKGEDNGIAIGYRGEALDAIQYLVSLYANKSGGEFRKVVVDAENYREKRVATLESLAIRLADKAVKTGRAVEVEPMNPYERKVFHTVLAENQNVQTESEGEEPNRYVVIKPVRTSQSKEYLNDFSRKGVGKLKTYGAPKKKYF